LYGENKGKITADFGRLSFTTPPLCAIHSLDAKYTTSDMAAKLQTWALFGPPLGKTWEPTPAEREKYPHVRPLVSNPWTVLGPDRPAEPGTAVAAVDLYDHVQKEAEDDEPEVHTVPAWHGTILPASKTADWLAAGFAEYERIVALEKALAKQSGGDLTAADQDRVAVAINAYRARHSAASRRYFQGGARFSDDGHMDRGDYDSSVGLGVLLLHELRQGVGLDKFCEVMDGFGRANAGKTVTTRQFWDFFVKQSGKNITDFVAATNADAARNTYAIGLFEDEREKALIVYGTSDDEAANRAAAVTLQEDIRTHWSNEVVPLKSDKDVSDDELRNHHLLLIGRPDANRVVERYREKWPVSFGPHSFTVRGKTYGHAGSAVLTAAANPLNPRYSAVVLAGLSAEATTRTPEAVYHHAAEGADVIILPHGGKTTAFVAPAREVKGAKR
jgi:hypothetical protein